MPSVGPQLPPHLAKRKRSIDDAEGPNSPPHKVQAASAPRVFGPSTPPARIQGPPSAPSRNPDELEVGHSSDDEYGPSTGSLRPAPPPARSLRPTLPPSKKPDGLDIDDATENDYGPSAAARPPAPSKRVLGPAAPPAALSERPSFPANDDDNSSSDDDYGPSLPPAPGSAAEASIFAQRQAEEVERAFTAETASKKPQRDDWMVVPPSDSDWSSRVDPTKLKNRKFASGKGPKAPAEKGGSISAIWTETAEQKRQRLEDEVLGRKDAATSSRAGAEGKPRFSDREEEMTARRIQEYNDKNRSRTLYEEHKGQEPKEQEDDPSKRGFDREKDMALGGRVSHVQKRDMLAKAADFGSRFQKGKYL